MAKIEAVEAAPFERAGPLPIAANAPRSVARGGPGGIARFVRSSPLGTVALLFLVVVMLLAVLADVITYWDPLTTNYGLTRAAPSEDHVLGTDHLGRDVWSRIVTGARISLFVALVAVLVGDGVGLAWGIVSGYFGGRVDMVSQRILDALLSFPGLILAMLLLVGLGAGLPTVIIAIAVTRIPLSTRVIRSVALSTKSLAYVEAARTVGSSPLSNSRSARRAAMHRPIPGDRLGQYRRRHHDGGRAELPRDRHPAADPDLGQHAWRRPGRVVQATLVACRVPRRGLDVDRAGRQSVRRCATRLP